MVEVVINFDHSVLFSVKAVEDQGLLVDTLSDELMVQRSAVNVVVVVVSKTGVVLNNISEAVRGKWCWSVMATSNSCNAAFD